MVHIYEYDELNELLAGLAARVITKPIFNAPANKIKRQNKIAKVQMKNDYKAFKKIN